VAVLQNSKFHIYTKKREEEKANENQHDCHEATSSIIHLLYLFIFHYSMGASQEANLGESKLFME
jgi:hypothetical protein